MSSEQSGSKLQIWIAIIGLLGVLGAATISNWDKIFPDPPGQEPQSPGTELSEDSDGQNNKQTPATPAGTAPMTLPEAQRQAERITANWVTAFRNRDVRTLMQYSIPPFFFDNNILLSPEEIRSTYEKLYRENRTPPQFTVQGIKSGTIREFKENGFITTNDRLLSRMRLDDNDLVVMVITLNERQTEEGVGFYFRRFDDHVELTGFWD